MVALMSGNTAMGMYLLACVAVAGLYAGYCGIKPALLFQTVPAVVALLTGWMSL